MTFDSFAFANNAKGDGSLYFFVPRPAFVSFRASNCGTSRSAGAATAFAYRYFRRRRLATSIMALVAALLGASDTDNE